MGGIGGGEELVVERHHWRVVTRSVIQPRVGSAEADRRVLGFAATQRVVVVDQVARLLGGGVDGAAEVVGGLVGAGLLARDRAGAGGGGYLRITAAGLEEIGSRLSAPGFEWPAAHAVGVGWLWLMAGAGSFGAVERVLSEPEMRLEDRLGGAGAPFASRSDSGARCFPDLLLLTESGRVPVQLLLVASGGRRLERLFRSYAADARVAAVLCLVVDPRLGRLVQSVAAWLELTALVHVQPVALGLGSRSGAAR